ncbi:LacI family DNA-binding transcriptional regulator [Paraburkholderia aspalathi]|uniref:LacI family DNA-binding transcriptional regulator n=1 Tax=Paraburkholderia aspalathi TaxID=1324617 RepID=UPI0038B7101B
MAHRFLIKEIALQAGLGVATVDRVLNGRANVREHTRNRVEQAIKELEKQELNLATTGRKLMVDVVVEAPARFSDEIKNALEAELALMHPAVVRPRFLLRETMTTPEVVDALRSIARRGSHGVFLKARDVPEIAEVVRELQHHGIPVVTVFTDIPLSGRIAYAGLDNRVAGATAAYLLGLLLGPQAANVLITMSDEHFRGEEEREISFRRALRKHHPQLRLIDASGGHGLDLPTEERVRSVLNDGTCIAAVYSMGGVMSRFFARWKRSSKLRSASSATIWTRIMCSFYALEGFRPFCIMISDRTCAPRVITSCTSTSSCQHPLSRHLLRSWS